jgi:hypothetical protein
MLDAYIIDQIKRREREEEERCREQERLWIEIPMAPEGPLHLPVEEEEAPRRGVVIIDL